MSSERNHKPYSVDWDALMMEFCQGDETLNKFRQRHDLAQRHFYQKVEEMGWEEKRTEMRAKALKKAETTGVNALAKRYSFQTKQWKTIEGLLARLLKRVNQRSGEKSDLVSDQMALAQLNEIAKNLERALKAQKLIMGEPTGEAPQGGEAPINHQTLVVLIQAMKNGDPSLVHKIIEGEAVREK